MRGKGIENEGKGLKMREKVIENEEERDIK